MNVANHTSEGLEPRPSSGRGCWVRPRREPLMEEAPPSWAIHTDDAAAPCPNLLLHSPQVLVLCTSLNFLRSRFLRGCCMHPGPETSPGIPSLILTSLPSLSCSGPQWVCGHDDHGASLLQLEFALQPLCVFLHQHHTFPAAPARQKASAVRAVRTKTLVPCLHLFTAPSSHRGRLGPS